MNATSTTQPPIFAPARPAKSRNVTNRERSADLQKQFRKLSPRARLCAGAVLVEQIEVEAQRYPESREVRYAIERLRIAFDQAATMAAVEQAREDRARR